MLKNSLVLLALAASLALAQDAERVAGASLITEEGDLQLLYIDLLGLPCDQEDVDLFLACMDPMDTWASANSEAWAEVDASGADLGTIFGLGVWAEVEVTAAEFVALLVKITGAKEVANGAMNVEEFKQMAAYFEGMAKDPAMGEEDREEAKQGLEAANKMIATLQSYPEGNIELYRSNKEKIDTAVERFQNMGETSSDGPKDDAGE